MRWLERLKLLVKADAHAVLEQLEERSLLVKQHLREAELELDRKRARCEALDDERRTLAEESARLDAEIRALDEDVELALAGEKEELARYAVRRLLPKRRDQDALARRRAELADERERLGDVLRDQEERFEEMTRLAKVRLEARPETAHAAPEPQAADEEVELELLRRRAAAGEAS